MHGSRKQFLISFVLTLNFCGNSTQDSCTAPLQPGHCNQTLSRYYYNASQSDCFIFNYTGCNGSANNFEEYNTCYTACVLSSGSTPPISGPSMCPVFQCNLACDRYKKDANGCELCECVTVTSCVGANFTCPIGKTCVATTENCTEQGCIELSYKIYKCVDQCPGVLVYDVCAKYPDSCDSFNCYAVGTCQAVGGCIERCRCPPATPYMLKDMCTASCPGIPEQILWQCRFDSAADPFCGIEQGSNDGGDFSYATSSTRKDSGPTKDHSNCGGHAGFLLLDANKVTRPPPEQFADLFITTPVFGPSNQSMCVKFWYYMYGKDIGRILVQRVTAASSLGLQNTIVKIGAVGSLQWQAQKYDLTGDTRQLTFRVSRGATGDAANIAIDDIIVTNKPCGQSAKESPICVAQVSGNRSGTSATHRVMTLAFFCLNVFKMVTIIMHV